METPQAKRRASGAERRAEPRGPRGGVIGFFHWFRQSKFDLMARAQADLRAGPDERDAAELERRFASAIRRANRVLLARIVVTLLLVIGVVATAAATVARALYVPPVLTTEVQLTLLALDRVAAIAGSVTVVLVGLRLLFDRYLELIDTSATFLAIQLASCPRAR